MIPVEDLEVQIPLIHVIESDDLYLQNHADVLWFDVLRSLDWRSLVELAARYYEALYQFNEDQAEERWRNAQTSQDSVPTESQKEPTSACSSSVAAVAARATKASCAAMIRE